MNSPIFPMIACWSLSMVFSILFMRSLKPEIWSWTFSLKPDMSPTSLLNSSIFSNTTCSAISETFSEL